MSAIALWWFSLAIFVIVVVVVAVLLGLIIATAKRIDQHAYAIWIAGKQIAGNTVSIWMLEKTNAMLESISDAVEEMGQSVNSVDEKLRWIAGTVRGRG